jgi:hypothetical protein
MTGHKQLSKNLTYFAVFIVPSTFVTLVPTPLYVMQPQMMTDFSVYTGTNTFRSECVIAFSPNIDSIVISNHNLALVRIK